MPERVQRADGRLADGGVRVRQQRHERARGRTDRRSAPARRRPRPRCPAGRPARRAIAGVGATVAEPAERDDGRELGVGIRRVQLLDEDVNDPRVLPDDRLDRFGSDVGLAEQPRQRAVDRLAAQPAKDRHHGAQIAALAGRDRVEDPATAGRA